MAQNSPNRWPLAIGLIVVAGGVLAWSLIAGTRDPATPTQAVPAGSHPELLTDEEKAFYEMQRKGGHGK
jgi:hypothetical protein